MCKDGNSGVAMQGGRTTWPRFTNKVEVATVVEIIGPRLKLVAGMPAIAQQDDSITCTANDTTAHMCCCNTTGIGEEGLSCIGKHDANGWFGVAQIMVRVVQHYRPHR